MDFSAMMETLKANKAIAVLRAPSAQGAIKACEAMKAGGLKLMEVTTTTPDWQEAICGVAKLGDIYTGVGTLITADQVKQAKDAGAIFAVSPGFDLDVADACLKCELGYAPGIATPTELMMAQKHPAVMALKLFPAGDLGGAKYLKSLRGPFPNATFIPTGGINAENAKSYLDAGAIAVGMSSICKGDVIKAENWDKVTADTRELLAALA